jgi:hypothetical protein
MRPYATSAWGLKLLVHAALSYEYAIALGGPDTQLF